MLLEMQDFFYSNFKHCLAAFILFSQLADIISTFVVTRKLKLEANLLARKAPKLIIIIKLLLVFLPYYNTTLAVLIIPCFLLVAARNIGSFWVTKTLGEEGYLDFVKNVAKKLKLKHLIYSLLWQIFFLSGLCLLIILFYPSPTEWGFWIALGVLIYPLSHIHHFIFISRLKKIALREENESKQEEMS